MKLAKLAVAARPLPLVSLVTLTAHTRVECEPIGLAIIEM